MKIAPSLIAAALILAAAGNATPNEIAGQASVIDGDTIEIHGSHIRLWGVDAPESGQLCRGDDSLPYRCGVKAANNLYDFLARRPVSCAPKDVDRYGRTVASCAVNGIDLGDWLVSRGLALDWPRYSGGHYAEAQRAAERASTGIWAGSFVEPWLYRACVRAGGRPAICSDDAAY